MSKKIHAFPFPLFVPLVLFLYLFCVKRKMAVKKFSIVSQAFGLDANNLHNNRSRAAVVATAAAASSQRTVATKHYLRH